MFGWRGKLLRVNLSTGEIIVDQLDPKVARDYIGGRGLGIYLMNQELDPLCDPLSPENMLIMATGPLTGTKAPTGARYMVMTEVPLPDGSSKGSVCHLDEMLDDYYALRGWSNDGIPTPEKLSELGIV